MTDYIERGALIEKICNEKCRSEYGKCQRGRVGGKVILCVCDFIRLQPAADVVSSTAYEQAVWERDLAITQLRNDYGVGLGEKKKDVAPVVHARWEECDYVEPCVHGFGTVRHPNEGLKCTNCMNVFSKKLLWKYNYCPNCGAKMDGGQHEAD